jgi:hypothetical protein
VGSSLTDYSFLYRFTASMAWLTVSAIHNRCIHSPIHNPIAEVGTRKRYRFGESILDCGVQESYLFWSY